MYIPANATNSSALPVKVFIYGGSNGVGSVSDPTYSGCYAAGDSLVVTLNYRLGPLGYLSVPSAGILGNFGIQDQLLALQWVQDNIASFGGNSSQVLLFGQSAGAVNVFVLSTVPQAPQLIRAAAMESGGGRDMPTVEQASVWNNKFVAALNCSLSDAECIRGVSLEALNETEAALVYPPSGVPDSDTLLANDGKGATWGPVIDGDVIATQPSTVGVKVPAIFGSNADDGSLFVFGAYGARALSLNETDYDAFLTQNFRSLAAQVNETYPLSNFTATNGLPPAYWAITSVLTAYAYTCPAYRGLSGGQGVGLFAYSFNHTPSCPWDAFLPEDTGILRLFGATHLAEIPFVLGQTENLPRPGGNCSFTAAEKVISAFMRGAWTSMAATGRAGDEASWPTWTKNESRGLVVGEDGVSVGVVDYSACEFWDDISAKITDMTSNVTSNSTTPSSTGTAMGTATGSGSTSTPTNAALRVRLQDIGAVVAGLVICVGFLL